MKSALVEISPNPILSTYWPAVKLNRHTKAFANLTRKMISLIRPSRNTVHSARLVSAATCAASSCAFSNAVVVLAPCIAHTPYITEDLLASHDATISSDFSHWDRDSFAHPPLTETVSESQSYPGMRKIVLVEGRRVEQVREVVRRIGRLNGGQFRERVEVYDWRILEDCLDHGKGAGVLKRHFIGATLFDDTQKRVMFVGEGDYLDT
jgi:DNA ligase-4